MREIDLLASTEPPPTAKASPSRLTPEHSVDDAIALILENCLLQVRANWPATEDGRDPEGAHQMRVGLRRLRAALQMLRKTLAAPGFERFETEAEALGDALGPVRNFDALDAHLAALRDAGAIDRRDHRALHKAVTAQRSALYGQVRAALGNERSRRFLEELAAWIADRGWRNELPERRLRLLARPARRLAERALDRLERQSLKRGRHFAQLSPLRRHKFRIATKKLRYAAKLFAPLFGLDEDGAHGKSGRRAKRYLRRLGKLQDALGEDHDSFVMPILLEDLGHGTDSPDAHRAIAAVLHAKQRRRPALREVLRKRRRQWKKAKGFW